MYTERIKKIYYYRATLWDMSLRQFKLSFAGLKLGIWWVFITPVILALSINLVFTEVLKMDMPNYTLFALSGIMPWFFLTASLQETAACLTANVPIIRQSISPRELIPMSVVIANLMNFLMGFILFIPVFIIFNPYAAKLLFLLPLVVAMQSLFVLGLGFLFSSLNIFFRDLSRLLQIGFMVWFWVTPVFYSLDMLSPRYQWICMLNPATHYIVSYQSILFEGALPPKLSLVVSVILAFISLIGGFCFFVRKESLMLKRI